MARRVVLGRMRQFLFRKNRVATTFPSRAGETISLVPNRRHYEKLKDVTASRRSGNPKHPGRVSQEVAQEPARSNHRTAPQSSGSESTRTWPKCRRSRVKIIVRKVRDSLRRFRETARATNLKICDLFPGNRMLAHVTAMPVSRTNKHVYPSPGLERQPIPVPNLSTSFRER
ncbi:hypothetical protein M758_4G050000 [Ceratodon purpureus]|nr:hypothetical protein M758_4G050000 [Ceratodon purpureus]